MATPEEQFKEDIQKAAKALKMRIQKPARPPKIGNIKPSKESIAALKAKFRATLKGAAAKSMVVSQRGLEQDLVGAMRDSVWLWPGSTVRQNGETAGSPRNIVDMGRLVNSLSWSKSSANVNGWKLTGKYAAPYATQVHYGAYIRPYGNMNATAVFIPGRPWVEGVLRGNKGVVDPYDFRGDYEAALEDVWKMASV